MTRARELAELAAAYDSGGLSNMRNRIINGAMVIDQRNAGAVVSAEGYLVDRWRVWRNQSYNIQQSTDAPTGFSNSLLVTKTSTTQSTYGYLIQYVEGFNFSDMLFGTASAQTVTLSFWVKSSVTGTFSAGLSNSAENRNYAGTYTISAANTWERKTITIPGDTSGTWIGSTSGKGCGVWFNFGASGSGTANAWAADAIVPASTGSANLGTTNNATFQITGVQLEKGSTATSFDYRPYGTELQLCQRYFEKSYRQTDAVGTVAVQGYTASTIPSNTVSASTLYSQISFAAVKRATPTVTIYGYQGAVGVVSNGNTGADLAANSGIANSVSTQGFGGTNASGGSITTASFGIVYHWTASIEL